MPSVDALQDRMIRPEQAEPGRRYCQRRSNFDPLSLRGQSSSGDDSYIEWAS